MATTVEALTAEAYARLPDSGRPSELVRGRIVEINVPGTKHGVICNRVGRLVGNFVEERDLGRVTNNDSGVITARNPDTVRGPDVSFYSYARWPEGPLPDGYLPVVPELVIEILSPDDRWSEVEEKTSEYLAAGVSHVCLIDPRTSSVRVYSTNQPAQTLRQDDELSFPEILAGFRVTVAKLFE